MYVHVMSVFVAVLHVLYIAATVLESIKWCHRLLYNVFKDDSQMRFCIHVFFLYHPVFLPVENAV